MGKILGLRYQLTQIQHFLDSLNRITNVFRALTPFEKFLESDHLKEALAKLYLMLVSQEQILDWSRKAWEKNFGKLLKNSSKSLAYWVTNYLVTLP